MTSSAKKGTLVIKALKITVDPLTLKNENSKSSLTKVI